MVCKEFEKDIDELIELTASLLKDSSDDEALKFNLQYLKGFKRKIVSGEL